MRAPKPPRETPEQAQVRVAEEARMNAMQVRADAEEAAAGRALLTKRTRRVIRLFGARKALVGGTAPSLGSPFGSTLAGYAPGGAASLTGGYSSASLPLGYSPLGSGREGLYDSYVL